MLYNLSYEYNLRGYAFEYISKITLRRQNKNNFIFQLSGFDSINEIINKYKLKITEKYEEFVNYLNIEWNKCDIIEFRINNKDERIVNEIIMYEVKTKFHKVERDYFEFCLSNHKFMKKCKEYNIPTKVISIILFEDWRFSFNILEFEKCRKRVYSQFKRLNNNLNNKNE